MLNLKQSHSIIRVCCPSSSRGPVESWASCVLLSEATTVAESNTLISSQSCQIKDHI